MKNQIKNLIVILLLFVIGEANSQNSIDKVTFNTEKKEIVQNDWLLPLLFQKNVNGLLKKYLEGYTEKYETKQSGENFEHTFFTYWRDNKNVQFTFEVDKSSKILSLKVMYPKDGQFAIVDSFRQSEKLENEQKLHFILSRSDVQFGWYNMSNGLFYELVENDDYTDILYVTFSGLTGKGYTYTNENLTMSK